MGVDFLICSIGFKKGESTRSVLAQCRQRIMTLTPDKLDEEAKGECEHFGSITKYRAQLLCDLAELRSAIKGYPRYGEWISCCDIQLFVSGGLSWGNPPSDLFVSMYRLQEARVLPDARWPEHARKRKVAARRPKPILRRKGSRT